MKKNVIYANKWENGLFMDIYYKEENDDIYLFTIEYSKKLFQYFKTGKSISQIKTTHKWNKNKRLDLLIEYRLPHELKILRRKGVSAING